LVVNSQKTTPVGVNYQPDVGRSGAATFAVMDPVGAVGAASRWVVNQGCAARATAQLWL